MKKPLFTLALLAALMFCGCDENNPINTIIDEITHPTDKQETPEEPIIRGTGIVDRIFNRQNPVPLHLAPSQNQMAYAQMGAEFAQKLFGELCLAAEPGENVCISPLSLEIALGMLANGVETSACTEMLDIIAGRGVTTDSLNVWYFKLRSALEATNCVRLANALWTQVGYPINPDFIAVNQTYYDAEVGHLDFANRKEEAADSIRQWAYDHTYGNIRELNLPIDNSTKLVLANATWFGANWAEPFEVTFTEKAIFTHSDGTTQEVDMMKNGGDYSYAEKANYQIVELPFGVFEKDKYGFNKLINTPYSMLIALPKEGFSANDILTDIEWEVNGKALVVVQIPKFCFKTTNMLIPPMRELGIKKLFTNPLSGINPNLSVGFINQDVSVKIDENGAEMAAVTVMVSSLTYDPDSPAPTPIYFNADHPFVFAVRENVSHNILFIGKVESIENN